MNLAEKHSLRGYDAVQLAAVLEVWNTCRNLGLPPMILVSADTALNESATIEEITVEDPNRRVS